jgi:hypothetical protein
MLSNLRRAVRIHVQRRAFFGEVVAQRLAFRFEAPRVEHGLPIAAEAGRDRSTKAGVIISNDERPPDS